MIPIKKTVSLRLPASAKHVLPKTPKGGTLAKCKQQQSLPDFHVFSLHALHQSGQVCKLVKI